MYVAKHLPSIFPNTDSKAFVGRTVCYDVVGLGCTCQEMSSIIAVSIHVR